MAGTSYAQLASVSKHNTPPRHVQAKSTRIAIVTPQRYSCGSPLASSDQDLLGPKGLLAMRSLLLTLSIVALLGCSRTDDPLSADDTAKRLAVLGSSGDAYYPLDIGNRWEYESTVTLT